MKVGALLKELLQEKGHLLPFGDNLLREEAFGVKPSGRKSLGLPCSKACWGQSRLHLLPDRARPPFTSLTFLLLRHRREKIPKLKMQILLKGSTASS